MLLRGVGNVRQARATTGNRAAFRFGARPGRTRRPGPVCHWHSFRLRRRGRSASDLPRRRTNREEASHEKTVHALGQMRRALPPHAARQHLGFTAGITRPTTFSCLHPMCTPPRALIRLRRREYRRPPMRCSRSASPSYPDSRTYKLATSSSTLWYCGDIESGLLAVMARRFFQCGIRSSVDYQIVGNPGYNTDRGPANIFAGRIHTQF